MEEQIEARVPPGRVWAAWEKARANHGQDPKYRYQILDVKEGERFSILWKTLFIRLIFTHKVEPVRGGSKISYGVQIKGPFAWPVRWFLGKKIQRNISLVLKAITRELEKN